ncbi:MAG: TatD family deoxyribonuclease [Dehalococcoidia bacterium]|nr:TatD family deoxyribonuclease [Dehalococcoidia bacterium]
MIDAHAHLDDKQFKDDLKQVLQRAMAVGVSYVLTAGSDLDSSRVGVAIAEQNPMVHAAVGYHPHEASRATVEGLQAIEVLSKSHKVAAIGEIGLDFYRNLSPADVQMKVFREQLEIAERQGMPVVVHSREADEDTYAMLAEWCKAGTNARCMMHCFGGDTTQADRYLELGFYISIAGPVTYPNNQTTRDVAKILPLDRLIVETDSPVLAPQRFRGKRNEPAYLKEIVDCIAEIKGLSSDEIATASEANTKSLFGLNTFVSA